MAAVVTTKYEELVLELETTPGGGTYARIAGLTDVTITRTSNTDTTEVPDADDESLPMSLERQVRSQEVTVSSSGVTAVSNFGSLLAWHRSAATRNIRLRNIKLETEGASGDIFAESGPALLTNLSQGRTKGQKVTVDVNIEFDGIPAVDAVA